MTISITCPSCEREYTLADTQEGKTIRCKSCDEKFVVEKPRRSRSRDEDEDRRPRQRPTRVREEDDEEPRPRRRSSADADRERTPRGGRKKGGIPPWVWLTAGGGLVLLIVGIVLLVVMLGKKEGDQGGKGPEIAGKADVFVGNLTVEKLRKLKIGMSEAEVSAIFGAPRHRLGKTVIWAEGPWQGPKELPTRQVTGHFKGGKLSEAHLDKFTPDSSEVLGGVRIPLGVLYESGYLTTPDPSKVTDANFNRIQHGMTEDQVIAILGPPLGRGDHPAQGGNPAHVSLEWSNGTKYIHIDFENGKVRHKY